MLMFDCGCRAVKKYSEMSVLWERSATWRWLVQRTRDSKPFFLAFATVCGVVPGVIGYGIMQFTNARNEQLEAHLRKNARPETMVILPLFSFILLFLLIFCLFPENM